MISGFSQLFASTSCVSHYTESRQMLFYCGLFSTFTGIFWILMGLIMKYGLPKPVGNSANSVAYGVILVGILVLIIGFVFTTSLCISSRIKNKTSAADHSNGSESQQSLRTEHKVSVFP